MSVAAPAVVVRREQKTSRLLLTFGRVLSRLGKVQTSLIEHGYLLTRFEGLRTSSTVDGTGSGTAVEADGGCQGYYVVIVRGLLWIVDVIIA